MTEVNASKDTINQVFSGTVYYIDFYQREYKWENIHVKILLDDIFLKFSQEYKDNIDTNAENISKYGWYYLNTYITNKIDGKVYIVDGQQRLTTLTLILIALQSIAVERELKDERITWLKAKIFGAGPSGLNFWMGHINKGDKNNERLMVFEKLFKSEVLHKDDLNSLTGRNMLENYISIKKRLEEELITVHKLDAFIFFFLLRIIIINLDVSQGDVPMVFEVINDRGMKLNPYEILKGKLLSQIDKMEVDEYNDIWEKETQDLEKVRDKDLVDYFFRVYFKAKFARNRTEGRIYDGDYHKYIFSPEFSNKINLINNTNEVKKFIKNDFSCFVNIYKEIYNYTKELSLDKKYLYFNFVNDLQTQDILLLSVLEINDPNKDKKIDVISENIDRLYVMLQLNRVYDSNRFLEIIYELSGRLENKSIEEYRKIFDQIIIEEVNKKRNLNVKEVLEYRFFKDVGYEDFNTRFLRYFFARIDKFFADFLELNMQDKFSNYVKGTGTGNSYHIEHILAHNDENLKIFRGDTEVFERERNRMGGLLLLKGKDNISSNNETYSNKIRTYQNTLFWNSSLTDGFYKSKTDVNKLINQTAIDLKPIDEFDQNALESRTEILYKIVKMIWE